VSWISTTKVLHNLLLGYNYNSWKDTHLNFSDDEERVCMTNGGMKEKDQSIFYNKIEA